ncbi:MAG TPA: response regulator transcription factor [Terriglobia bacterium]|nr:response regulator transcription factor [Terriglobia bacterium]
MDKIRILLLDDHALFREGLSRLLEGEPDLEMAACCASVSEATDALHQMPIDLVLLDYDLGKERGYEFMAQARQRGFQGRFLMVTAGMSDAESVRALDLGVSGIFPKHSSPMALIQAIRKVMTGETWLDENAIQALVRASKHPQGPNQPKPFTERENQVLQGVFEGLSNKEIGARLNISESSVKAALQQLFQKTGVRTRSQLVRIALEEHGARWK